MPLHFLLDEHFRGLFFRHVQRYNARHDLKVNALRVGDPPELPLGTSDPKILAWAEREGRGSSSRWMAAPFRTIWPYI
jgi:hypothetical protein